jgi:predicted TIM-barrel fold metal-dependent hydrolase
MKIDCHVHLVGNGKSGSGCWIRMAGWHRMMGFMMSKMMGMPVGIEHEDFDEVYVTRLRDAVAESSLDRAMLLAQDEVYREDGTKRDFGSFHVPNDYLFEICEAHPEFVPAVSIHPARRDALEELDRCLARGARALKLLPNCLDVNCALPAYGPFWEKMAEAGLPLLAHTGGEMTVPVANRSYENPAILRRPLEIGVKVIAAHAASNSGFFDTNHLPVLSKIMAEFPNLYADTSALNSPMRSGVLKTLLHCEFRDRLVHGSDYPVPAGAWYARLRGLIDGPARKRAAAISNPIERDYQLKVMVGFEDADFTRLWDILRYPPDAASQMRSATV